MKKLFLAAAIVGMTSLTAFAGNGNGGGCKGKGCTCTGNCKDEKCTMACCKADSKKSCTDSKCMKDGKCTKETKSSSSSSSSSSAK